MTARSAGHAGFEDSETAGAHRPVRRVRGPPTLAVPRTVSPNATAGQRFGHPPLVASGLPSGPGKGSRVASEREPRPDCHPDDQDGRERHHAATPSRTSTRGAWRDGSGGAHDFCCTSGIRRVFHIRRLPPTRCRGGQYRDESALVLTPAPLLATRRWSPPGYGQPDNRVRLRRTRSQAGPHTGRVPPAGECWHGFHHRFRDVHPGRARARRAGVRRGDREPAVPLRPHAARGPQGRR